MSDNNTLKRPVEEKSMSNDNTHKRLKRVEENFMSDNNFPQIKKYDVFISFRREIRHRFLSHLVDTFKSKKVNAFVDDWLERGDKSWPSLVDAIEGSSISLIIFSPDYASSYRCLEELVTILECREKYGRIVIPVFYHVEPTQVGQQSSHKYKNAFSKHERKYNSKVQIWRDALNKSADLSGIESSNYQTDAELLKEIINLVQDVLTRLDKPLCSNSKGFVGLEEKIAYVESLIRKEPNRTRLIGIWGMGGIGKTTLAEKVFDKLRFEYEGCYFSENEGENFKKHLEKNFSKLLGYDVEIDKPDCLSEDIIWRICGMKILIVLDDVKDSTHLEGLFGALANFGSGSRIIVTTRDKCVLNQADEIYRLEEFSFDEALELFNLNAFKQSDQQWEYHELSKRMVHYARGIPLVLTVLARHLCGENKEVWKSELEKLKKMANAEVYDVLKLSYDDLSCEEQKIFLDLSCFILRLQKKVKVCYLRSLLKDDESDNSVAVGLERLKDKALITFTQDNFISMHDILQEMGWDIVRGESTKEPENCRWLWDPNDIWEALENGKGTKAIRSIQIDFSKMKEQKLSPAKFTTSGLKFLEIYNGSHEYSTILAEGLQLRFLSWYSYPLTTLPENFFVEKLVILELRGGKMEKLWDGIKNMVNLKELDLSQSGMLQELPDLSKAINLEVLVLKDCSMLTSVHPSIFSLPKLEKLDLLNCMSLTILASNSHLQSLSYLNLDGCENLVEFSVISPNMKDLRLRDTTVKALPSSFGYQSKLTSLHLGGSFIERLPSSFYCLVQLLYLEVTDCSQLHTLPELPLSLETLKATRCYSLQSLPDLPPYLKTLNITFCSSLQTLPKLPPSLKTLNVVGCNLLQSLPELPPFLQKLNLRDWISLQSIAKLPPSLKTLNVESCRLQTLPELPHILVVLNLKYCSSLQTIPKLPPSLKTLNVKSCGLQTLPELPRILVVLNLKYCSSLQTIPKLPPSLETLNAISCNELHSLPDLPPSLKTMNVNFCESLQTLPELPPLLETLSIQYCSSLQTITKLPTSLETLNTKSCDSLQSLPELPPSLKTLHVEYCQSLQTLPELPPCLKILNVKSCQSLQCLPELPSFLETLNVEYCVSLQSLPKFPVSLKALNVMSCILLQFLPEFPPFLENLNLQYCASFHTVAKLPPSLRTLNVMTFTSHQSLPELPQSLEILDVRSSSSLQSLPNLPPSLTTINARYCSSLQTLPELPQWLETLDVSCCTSLQTLPELPQWLETLDVRECTSLQTLPKLPSSLKTLNANDCKSLKTVEFSSSTTIEQLSENRTRVLFLNCLELDEHSLVAIGLNAQINVMKFAKGHLSTSNHSNVQDCNDYDVNHSRQSYQAVYVYPGSSVPDWFEYKTTNDYIIIDPSSAPHSPMLGFIFCFILRAGKFGKGYADRRLEVHITISEHDSVRMYIDVESWKIKSDHLCVVYDQKCSSILNRRAKIRTRFKIKAEIRTEDRSSHRCRFGISSIDTSAYKSFIEDVGLRNSISKFH